jgi:copper chaperone CopZ
MNKSFCRYIYSIMKYFILLMASIIVVYHTNKTRFMKILLTVKSFFIIAVLSIAVACNSTGKKVEKAVDDGRVANVEVSVTGMTCASCEQTIQKNVARLEGIKSVKALAAMGKAFIEYSPSLVDTARIRTAITESGYSVTGFASLPPSEPVK